MPTTEAASKRMVVRPLLPCLRRGLCEAIGLLMARSDSKGRHIAVVLWTVSIERLATKISARARLVGIDIATISANGEVSFIS